jgi:hypothetical protein
VNKLERGNRGKKLVKAPGADHVRSTKGISSSGRKGAHNGNGKTTTVADDMIHQPTRVPAGKELTPARSEHEALADMGGAFASLLLQGITPAPVLKNSTTDPSFDNNKYKGMLIPLHSVVPGVPGPNPVSEIVQVDYTKEERNVPDSRKAQVAERDGLVLAGTSQKAALAALKNYEVDHLIPLVWGGDNPIGNLWAQPIDQARIKDVVEVHGRMFLRANQNDESLKRLQSAKNWIDAAVNVVDPFLNRQTPANRVTMLTQVAEEFAKAGNNGLAAAAYRELATIHGFRPPLTHVAEFRMFTLQKQVHMDRTDFASTADAAQKAAQYGALAARYAGMDRDGD